MPGHGILRPGSKRAGAGIPLFQPYIAPLAADVGRVVAAEAPSATAGTSKSLTIANAKPDPTCGRVLSYSVTVDADADLTADFITEGVCWYTGETITEEVTGVTLAGGAQLGGKVFRSITSIDCVTATSADVDAADRVAVGIGAHFSPHVKIKATGDVKAAIACAAPATSSAAVDDLAAGGAVTMVDAKQGFAYYTPNDAPDGATWYWLNIQSTYDGAK